ncbi:MAG: helix-turn-helix domain-containing protein [Steroidobacteraceae bacterium]
MRPSKVDVTMAADLHSEECPKISQVLARIGEKWSVLIIMMLAARPRRFSELKRAIGGISQRMLTLSLRGLERDGLVKRTVYPVVPPRVEYELTPLGRALHAPVSALGEWARSHLAEIDAARAAFDHKAALEAEKAPNREDRTGYSH